MEKGRGVYLSSRVSKGKQEMSYQATKNERDRTLEKLLQKVYEININQDPKMLTMAVLDLRSALKALIREVRLMNMEEK